MSAAPLYLHIGTHKTGSTAIQDALRQDESRLRAEKLVYLSPPPDAEKIMRAGTIDKKVIAAFRKYLVRITSSVGSGHSFVMSYEGFSGDPTCGYGNASVVARTLQEVLESFDVRVVAYLRRQDAFVESLYTQEIHQGESLDFDEFLERQDPSWFDWFALLEAYAASFGRERLMVRRYDKAVLPPKGGVVADFREVIGSTALDGGRTSWPNAGLCRDALELARLCNPHLDEAGRARLRRILQSTNAKATFEDYDFFSNSQRAQFLRRYVRSNSQVAKEYLDDSSGRLFGDPESTVRAYAGLTLENVGQVVGRALAYELPSPQEDLLTVKLARKVEDASRDWLQRQPVLKSAVRRFLVRVNLFPNGKS